MKTAATMACACALALAFAPHPANADLLYWMVDSPTESWTEPGTATPIYFAYATVSADGTPLTAYDQGGDTGGELLEVSSPDPVTGNGTGTGAAYFGSFEYAPNLNFLVELWNADDERVGWQSYRASDIADSIFGGDDPRGGSGATPLAVSEVVPEPTSGMLILLGLAGLALRRRRAV